MKTQEAGVETTLSDSDLDQDLNAANSVAHLLSPDCDGKGRAAENGVGLEMTTTQEPTEKEINANL